MYIRFAHVHERVLLLRFVDLLTANHQRFTHETRNNSEQAIGQVETETAVLMSRSTKVISTR